MSGDCVINLLVGRYRHLSRFFATVGGGPLLRQPFDEAGMKRCEDWIAGDLCNYEMKLDVSLLKGVRIAF